MKKLLLSLIVILSLATGTQAQSITKDATGNYTATKKAPGTSSDKKTGTTYNHTDGNQYPLFIGKRGGIYCFVPDKTGTIKKKYMPK